MEAVSRHEDPALFGGLYSRGSFFDDESDSTRSVALPASLDDEKPHDDNHETCVSYF